MSTIVLNTDTNEEIEINYDPENEGIDCSWDIIANLNFGSFTKETDEDGEETGRLLGDTDEIEWWQAYFRGVEDARKAKRELIQDLWDAEIDACEIDRVRDEFADICFNDAEDEPGAIMALVKEIRGRYAEELDFESEDKTIIYFSKLLSKSRN